MVRTIVDVITRLLSRHGLLPATNLRKEVGAVGIVLLLIWLPFLCTFAICQTLFLTGLVKTDGIRDYSYRIIVCPTLSIGLFYVYILVDTFVRWAYGKWRCGKEDEARDGIRAEKRKRGQNGF